MMFVWRRKKKIEEYNIKKTRESKEQGYFGINDKCTVYQIANGSSQILAFWCIKHPNFSF